MLKQAQCKIAFIGTSCSGKTTAAMGVAHALKKQSVLTGLVISEDSKMPWNWRYFPKDFIAYQGMFARQMYAEVEITLRPDIDVVVSDRSILDLAAIAITDHPTKEQVLKSIVDSWIHTYDYLFYLPPIENYQEDGVRPPNEFRMNVHANLISMLSEPWIDSGKVCKVDNRDTVISDVVTLLEVNHGKSFNRSSSCR